MTQRETNLRSVLFLVIGILLLLSLVICLYIVSSESDLVKVTSEVTEIKTNAQDAEDIEIYVNYDVDGQSYKYLYEPDNPEEYKMGDKVVIYYHEKAPSSVQTFKTSKLIFIWPVIGLALCILGIFELFRKTDDDDDESEFETSVIGVVGNTQQLKIVTDDVKTPVYEPTPEEVAEAPVKAVVKEVAMDSTVIDASGVMEETTPVVEVAPQLVVTPEPVVVTTEPVAETAPASSIANPDPVPTPVPVTEVHNVEPKPQSSVSKMDEAIVKQVQSNVSGAAAINEDDIKEVIKNVLKEVIQEVKEEKPAEPVVQKRVLPNYYYISGTSLIYEEAGKEPKEIELKTVKSVVRTINSAGNVVKLVVSNDAVKCVLTNMKNIDLEQVASLLNNKMRTIDEGFKEEIEYKEY